jgi:hypothetical protein
MSAEEKAQKALAEDLTAKIKQAFPDVKLKFEVIEQYLTVKPESFLGSDVFANLKAKIRLVEASAKNGGNPCVIVELKTRCSQSPYLYFMLSQEVIEAWKKRYGEWISPSVWEIIELGEKL